ncbi:NUDIX hydrolase [Arcticibacter sp.]|uniref:NUDIX hydrolase n=1 Tax=Arcticibacter sp. TaxID=1872630 RepID=UPI00388D8A87
MNTNMSWQVLEEKDVSPSRWFPILQHKVKMPNGTIIDDYFFSPIGNVAMVLPLTSDGNFILVKQYKHGLQDIFLELPGGMQQKGKSIEASAVAELEEETGIKITLDRLIPLGKIANNPTKTNQITYGFLVKDAEFNSVQRLDTTEQIELMELSPSETIELIKDGSIRTSDTVALIFKAYLDHPEIFV